MKRLLGCLIIVGLVFVQGLFATDYYVDGNNGNDNNNGLSIGAAWRTITKANSTLTAGDTIYVLAGVYSTNDGGAIINPDNNGTSGNPITYTNYGSDEVILRSISDENLVRGAFIGRNYITIDGLTFDNISQSQSKMEYFMTIGTGKHHIIIRNCTMRYLEAYWDGPSTNGIDIYNNCTYCQILNNTISHVGRNGNNGAGHGIKFNSVGDTCDCRYNLVEGNTISYCGHACVLVLGEYNIIRGNTFDNPWEKCVDIIQDRYTSHNSYNVISDNIFRNAGSSDLAGNFNGIQLAGTGNIIRKNRIYGNYAAGLLFFGRTDRPARNNGVYNNVFYNNGLKAVSTNDTGMKFLEYTGDQTCIDNDIRNNINYNNYDDGVTYVSCNAGEQTFLNNHWDSYGNPQFINPGNNNFHLNSSSSCIDAGIFLTRTRSSGSGTQIPVEDAAFFCDGFDVTQGDTIQLEGQMQTARITGINYSTNTITVNSSLSWYSGQGMSLAYSGYAPDMGAYEYTGSTPPTPLYASANGSPGTGYIPLTVNFTGSATGGTPPYSYSWTFGDGGTSTSQNPSHTYNSAGDFTATLTVTDNASNQDSDSIIIHTSSLSENFTLSLSSSTGAPAPGSGGTVSPSPGNHTYSSGTNIQLEATPNSNYRFSRWTGDVSDSVMGNTQFTLTMDANKSISAMFCTRCGDVNGSLTITPIDAQLIFDIFLGILSNPTLCQRENADVNNDGTKNNPNVTPIDAQAIFDFYLGKSGLPGDCSCNSRSSTSGSLMTMTSRKNNFDFNILIQDPLTLPGGDEILVPVMIDSSIRLESFGFDLVFDSEHFEFVGVTRAELTEDFIQVGANIVEDGILRVGGYREQTVEDCSPGELVILIFKVKRESEDPTTFQIFKTYDDLKNATVDTEKETLVR